MCVQLCLYMHRLYRSFETTHVYPYLSIYLSIHLSIYLSIYLYIYLCIHVHRSEHKYIYIYTYIYIYVHTAMYPHMCMCIYIYTHTYTHTCIHTYIHITSSYLYTYTPSSNCRLVLKMLSKPSPASAPPGANPHHGEPARLLRCHAPSPLQPQEQKEGSTGCGSGRGEEAMA